MTSGPPSEEAAGPDPPHAFSTHPTDPAVAGVWPGGQPAVGGAGDGDGSGDRRADTAGGPAAPHASGPLANVEHHEDQPPPSLRSRAAQALLRARVRITF